MEEVLDGACPEGWHLPSKDEWELNVYDGEGTAETFMDALDIEEFGYYWSGEWSDVNTQYWGSTNNGADEYYTPLFNGSSFELDPYWEASDGQRYGVRCIQNAE